MNPLETFPDPPTPEPEDELMRLREQLADADRVNGSLLRTQIKQQKLLDEYNTLERVRRDYMDRIKRSARFHTNVSFDTVMEAFEAAYHQVQGTVPFVYGETPE